MPDYSTMSESEIKAAVAERVMPGNVWQLTQDYKQAKVGDFLQGRENVLVLGEDGCWHIWNPMVDASAEKQVLWNIGTRDGVVEVETSFVRWGRLWWQCRIQGRACKMLGFKSSEASPGRAVCEASLQAVDAMEGKP